MNILIAKETRAGETRVAATPETVKKLVGKEWSVAVEAGAGETAYFPDATYETAGASIVPVGSEWSKADVILGVREPSQEAMGQMRSGSLFVGFLAPHSNLDLIGLCASKGISTLAMELIPRITRAQSMDALSSQASIAGYKAAVLAATYLPSYFPLMMTAAGTVPPARVVVMGAGVAGLQALATAKRLGAIVEVSDIRPAVKEQVESLGGRFIDVPLEESGEGQGGYAKEMGEDFLRKQREIVAKRVSQADVVITTALIPGRPAPMLVPKEMVEAMKPGSVIVDLAIEQGGNCALSQADQEVMHQGVRILAPSNVVATLPADASTLYARNVYDLLTHCVEEGELRLDREDDILAGALLTHGGDIRHQPTAEKLATLTT